MNDGVTDDITIEDTTLNTNDPSIQTQTIDLSATGTVSNIYKFKLRVRNMAGYVDSSALSVALASLPSKPTSPPATDVASTNQY